MQTTGPLDCRQSAVVVNRSFTTPAKMTEPSGKRSSKTSRCLTRSLYNARPSCNATTPIPTCACACTLTIKGKAASSEISLQRDTREARGSHKTCTAGALRDPAASCTRRQWNMDPRRCSRPVVFSGGKQLTGADDTEGDVREPTCHHLISNQGRGCLTPVHALGFDYHDSSSHFYCLCWRQSEGCKHEAF